MCIRDRRRDGSEFPVEIGLSYFKTNAGLLSVSFVSDITGRKRSEETLLQYQKELQALTARLLGLQEAGNKELARELHDDLSQKLAALGMEVSTLLPPFPNPVSYTHLAEEDSCFVPLCVTRRRIPASRQVGNAGRIPGFQGRRSQEQVLHQGGFHRRPRSRARRI